MNSSQAPGTRARERLRLFVAANLPPGLRDLLGTVQQQFALPETPLRWTRVEGLHITLKFLGETPDSQVEKIERAVTRAVDGCEPFALRLDRLGCFPSASRPRVLWIGVAGDIERLQRLQRRVDRHLADLGYPRSARPFEPHVTLARAREPLSTAQAAALEQQMAEAHFSTTPFPVESLELMRSCIQPGGAVYEQVHTFPLRHRIGNPKSAIVQSSMSE